MKDSDQQSSPPLSRRIAGTSLLRAYALLDATPSRLKFSDYPVRFKGFQPELVGRGLAWGIYGTNSINLASSLVSLDAQRTKRHAYFLDLNYVITPENSITSNSLGTRREQVRQWIRQYVQSRQGEHYAERLQGKDDLLSMLRECPMLAHAYMNSHKDVDAFGYEVCLPSHGADDLVLQIVLFRKRLENVRALNVRYHQNIVVKL